MTKTLVSKVIQGLSKWFPDMTRMLMSSTVDEIAKHFEEHCKLFNAHSYINFTSGFELTNKLFARFVQKKALKVDNFEKQVNAFHDDYFVKDELSNKEMATRDHLLHTISTVHLMESFVQNVKLVDETERKSQITS